MIATDGWVWLARVRRTQGRKGEVFAEILTDFPEKFADRRRLWLLREEISASKKPAPGGDLGAHTAPREVELVHHWLHKDGVVLHFAGVDSISAAEQLAGVIVAVPREERTPLGEGAVYIGDLIGCVLVDVGGADPVTVGEIEDVDRNAGPVPLLVVRGKSTDEILIPFAKDFLRLLDVDAKRVEMALPQGLVDLNVSQ